MRDVLGPDRVLGEAAREGRTDRVVAVRLEQGMELLDIPDPGVWPAVDDLGEVAEGRSRERHQVLPLQIAPRALARNRRHGLGAVLGQRRALAGLPLPRVFGTKNRPATIRTRSR